MGNNILPNISIITALYQPIHLFDYANSAIVMINNPVVCLIR